MPLEGQLLAAHRRGVLDKAVRLQIDDIQLVVVRGQRPRDILVALALVGLADGQHGDGQRDASRDRVDAHPPDGYMHLRSVRHHFVKEQAVGGVVAPLRGSHERGAVSDRSAGEIDGILRGVEAEEALHEIPVGPVAAHIARPVAGDLQYAHGQRIIAVLKGAAVLAGGVIQIEQVRAADGFKVGGLLRVFKPDLYALPVPLQDLLKRVRLTVVEALQLGAADLPQERDLAFRLHALADRVHAQGGRHLHHLREDDLAVVALVELAH